MKTKTFKRLAAAAAAISMMCAVPMMSMPNVWAANTPVKHNITVSGNASYKAYKIFDGDYSSGKLSNIDWNADVNSTQLLSDIKTSTIIGSSFSLALTAADVAGVLTGWNETNNKAELAEFARLVKKNLNNPSSNGDDVTGGTAASLDEGYYLLVDQTTGSLASRPLLALNGDVNLSPKTVLPTIEKKVKNGDNWETANTESVGELVDYKLTAPVPDMTGYNQYFYVINDKLSSGMELKANSFKVYVGGEDDSHKLTENKGDNKYTATTGYYVELYTETASDNTAYNNAFRLVFNNFVQYQGEGDIIITYQAYLGGENKKLADKVAYVTTAGTGNTNTVDLIYSNNPNHEYKGTDTNNDSTNYEKPYEPPMEDDSHTPNDPTDDTPKSDEPSDKTSPQKVDTYTAKIELTKIDGSMENNQSPTKLSGAKFIVYSDSNCSTAVTGEVTSDTNGIVNIDGLGAGTYWIKETVAPAGYNLLTSPLKLVIATDSLGNSGVAWKIGDSSDSSFSIVSGEYTYKATVKNNAGTTLPSTGGIGTTIFYVSGGALILGAGIVLVTKKRMSLKDDK